MPANYWDLDAYTTLYEQVDSLKQVQSAYVMNQLGARFVGFSQEMVTGLAETFD